MIIVSIYIKSESTKQKQLRTVRPSDPMAARPQGHVQAHAPQQPQVHGSTPLSPAQTRLVVRRIPALQQEGQPPLPSVYVQPHSMFAQAAHHGKGGQGQNAEKSEEKVAISGFGTFTKKHRAARVGMNPATKEPIQIGESTTCSFKPSQHLKDSRHEPKPMALQH